MRRDASVGETGIGIGLAPAPAAPDLMDGLPAILWQRAEDGRFSYVSAHAERALGHPRAAWLEVPEFFDHVLYPDDRAGVRAHLDRLVEAGGELRHEYRLVAVDGTVRWFQEDVTAAETEFGRRLNGVAIDITDRRSAELSLGGSQHRLKLAQEAASIGTFDWDVRSNTVAWDGVEPIHGLEPGAFGGTFDAYAADIHPDDRGAVLETITGAVGEGADIELEYRIVRPDGEVRWVSGRGRSVKDASGRTVRVVGTCMDITERKLAQDALLFHASLLDAVGEAVIATAIDGKITYWNAAAEQLFGWPREEAIGRDIGEVTVPPEGAGHGEAIMASLSLGERWSGEFTCRRRDGSLVELMITNSPVFSSTGEVVGMIGVSYDLTARNAAERELAASEQRYRSLANALPGMISMSRIDGSMVYYNDHWFRYTGLSPEDVQEFGWSQIIHPDDFKEINEAWRGSVRDGSPLLREARLRRADGEYRWHLGRAVPLDSGGKADSFVVAAVDIHDRKLAEERIVELNRALERRIAEMTAVLDVVPIGIGIAEDSACDVIRANPAFERMLGVEHEANASLTAPDERMPFKVVYPDGGEVPSHELPMQASAARGETISDQELDVVRDDGSVVHLLEYATPLRDDAGEVVGSVGAFVDITRRKRAEQALRFLAEASEALSSSLDYHETLQQLARLVVPRLADWCAIDIIDDAGRVQRLALANKDPEREQRVRDVIQQYPIRPDAQGGVGAVLRTRQPQFFPEVNDDAIRAATADAERADLLRRANITSHMCVPLVARGRTVGAISLVTAESRRKLTEADFALAKDLAARAAIAVDNARLFREAQQTAEDLRRANEAKDEFLGLVSHELRTPITTIFGNAQVIRRRAHELDEVSRREAILDIEQETERLHRIVENMLVLARIETGREVPLEPVLLHHVVRQAVEAHMARHPLRQVRLDAPRDGLPPVLAESTYSDQVFRNLLSNAEKYSPSSEAIDVRMALEGNEISVSVLDRGPGIDPQEAEEIFSAFYRSHRTSGQASGAGMGLAVCKRLIEAQEGRIWARPRDGGGSEFGFSLPVVKEVQ